MDSRSYNHSNVCFVVSNRCTLWLIFTIYADSMTMFTEHRWTNANVRRYWSDTTSVFATRTLYWEYTFCLHMRLSANKKLWNLILFQLNVFTFRLVIVSNSVILNSNLLLKISPGSSSYMTICTVKSFLELFFKLNYDAFIDSGKI